VAFTSSFTGARGPIRDAVEKIVGAYRRRYGAPGPVSVLVRAPGTIDAEGIWGTGRRRGFVLELPADASLDAHVKVLLAHEAFHLWNGHELVPRGGAASRRTLWFKEGLTQYIAIKTLRRLSMLSMRGALDLIAAAAASYAASPLRAGGDGDEVQRRRFPYDRGLMVAMLLDDALLRASDGRRSIDDWLGALLHRAIDARREDGHLYGLHELQRALFAIIDSRATLVRRRWNRHVLAAEPIDIREAFQTLGLHFLDAEGRRRPKLVPLAGGSRRFDSLLRTQQRAPSSGTRRGETSEERSRRDDARRDDTRPGAGARQRIRRSPADVARASR
jgi:hypothetical protein